nr:aldo/keto reductase [Microbacterium marinum]
MATVMREPNAGRRERLLDAAYEQGFRYFDVAPIYGFGTAEAEIGKLVGRGATDLQVATKFGRDVTQAGSMIRRLQQPARWVARAVPGVRHAFRQTSGGVRSTDAPALDEFRANLDLSLAALRLDSVETYLSHEIEWSDEWTALWEQLRATDLPIKSIGISGSHSLLQSYPSTVVDGSPVMQLPLTDAHLDVQADVLYAAVSTLRTRFGALSADRAAVLDRWNLRSDTDDYAVTGLLVAAAIRRYPQARVLVGTTSVSHLAAFTREVPIWSESTSVDWRTVEADLFDVAGAIA